MLHSFKKQELSKKQAENTMGGMREHYSDGMGPTSIGSTCRNLELQWHTELNAGDYDAASRTEAKLQMHYCDYDRAEM